MELKRKDLESALSAAKPALASKTTIEDLKCYWFDGKYVYTSDAGLGIRVRCQMIPCGLPGKALLDLVKTATRKFYSWRRWTAPACSRWDAPRCRC